MRYAAWLQDNLPTVDRLSVVHGDYRLGNVLFNEVERPGIDDVLRMVFEVTVRTVEADGQAC